MRASTLKTARRATKTSTALTVHLGARERQRAYDLATVRGCTLGRLFEELLDAAEARSGDAEVCEEVCLNRRRAGICPMLAA